MQQSDVQQDVQTVTVDCAEARISEALGNHHWVKHAHKHEGLCCVCVCVCV